MIVDTHVHVISEDRARYPLSPGARGWAALGVVNSVDDFMRLMTNAGVDKAVLVQPATAYGYDNAYHADSQAKHADRAASVALLDPNADDSAEQFAHWILHRHMSGIRVPIDAFDVDTGRGSDFWRGVADRHIPVLVASMRGAADVARVAAFAKRFPEMPIAPDHMAGWSEWQERESATEALLAVAQLQNVYLRITTPSLEWYGRAGDGERTMFKRVVDAFGPGRTMWGSNYPASSEGGYARQVEIAFSTLSFLPEDHRQWVFGGTAVSLWPQLGGGKAIAHW